MTVEWIASKDLNPMDRKHRVVLFDDEGIRWCGWKVYDPVRCMWLNCETQPIYWLNGLELPDEDNRRSRKVR